MNSRYWRWSIVLGGALVCWVASGSIALAQSTEVATQDLVRGINTVWVLIAAFLVFFMQAGFAFLEAGSTHQKNTVSILMKNLIDFSVATVVFWAVGYAFMFGAGTPVIGLEHFFLMGVADRPDLPALAFWLFQLVFAGTAATIVSGAMAERTKFNVYLLSSVCMTAVIYPIFGHWAWSDQGWLANLPLGTGFHDFAGSTVVHSVGGWAALAGAFLLGPRLGRFDAPHSDPESFRGQSVPFATLGVFILWLAWFGFNPGSQLAAVGANADAIALVAANTNIAAAAGAMGALLLTRALYGSWRLTTTLNGVLGGLVAITASCDRVEPLAALLIGLIGGVVVTLGTRWLVALRIDDPVGAVPAHLFAGIWGTLAVGLFANDAGLLMGAGPDQLLAQLVGVLACGVWAGTSALLFFFVIRQTIGLRVSAEVERQGLDATEHGETGYSGFKHAVEDTPSAKLPSATPR
jgi:Amt family ammonium transporter